jgi:hypothetical protein
MLFWTTMKVLPFGRRPVDGTASVGDEPGFLGSHIIEALNGTDAAVHPQPTHRRTEPLHQRHKTLILTTI